MSDLRIDPSSTWAWQALTGAVSARTPRLTASAAPESVESPAAEDSNAAGSHESTATFLIFAAMSDLTTSPSLLKHAVDAYTSSRDDAGAGADMRLRSNLAAAEALALQPLLSLLSRT